VLSVVAFHVAPQFWRGGFVGVDIFFVISGFLISSIICKGLDDGTFSFVDFYERRIRRIFPALIVVLLACLLLGWLVLLADEYEELGSHTKAAGILFEYPAAARDRLLRHWCAIQDLATSVVARDRRAVLSGSAFVSVPDMEAACGETLGDRFRDTPFLRTQYLVPPQQTEFGFLSSVHPALGIVDRGASV